MNWLGLTNVKEFDIKSPTCPILSLGMSEPESWGRWTSENNVKLIIPRDPTYDGDVAIIIELMAHTHGKALESQNVTIFHGGRVISEWNIPDKWYRLKGLLIPFSALSTDEHIELDIEIPDAESPKKFGGSDDDRKLGIGINRIWVGNINDPANVSSTLNIIGSRYVGTESRKTWDHKHLTGFWKSYITGPKVLDVGFSSYGDPRVVPIMEDAIGVDIDYPGYDGKYLPFGDCSQDAVYSSHCLEHIPDHLGIIQDWHRVTKVGGHIIIAVPSRDLFERRRRPPSSWNTEHLRMYTCASLLAEIEAALAPNTFKIRHLSENDDLFDYNLNPTMPPYGNYEITAVIEKIEAPEWRLVE